MPKLIPLTQGKFAIVDDEDYGWLNQWKWFSYKDKNSPHYYAARGVWCGKNTKLIFMHRILIKNKGEGYVRDHVNRNSLDNRKSNLRICKIHQNFINAPSYIGNSKFKGVYWNKNIKKWHSRIGHNNKRIHLGFFKKEIEAARAYDKKAKELFGDCCYVNLGY